MSKEGVKLDDERGEPQTKVLRSEQFYVKISSSVLLLSLLFLVFSLILFLCYIAPNFVSLYEDMNITMPLPTKIVISLVRICNPIREYEPLRVGFIVMFSLAVIISIVKMVIHLSGNAVRNSSRIFGIEMRFITGILIFFVILSIAIFMALLFPFPQFISHWD